MHGNTMEFIVFARNEVAFTVLTAKSCSCL